MNRPCRNILALNMLGESHEQTNDENIRRHGRVRIEEVGCSLGQVMDLSRSGMRLITRKCYKSQDHVVFTAVIEAFDERVEVPCRAVWSRKAGLFKHEVGFEFGELNDEQACLLGRIARTAASNAHLHAG